MTNIKPTILYEDNHIIAALKPHGVPTQTKRISEPDMVSILKNHLYDNGSLKAEPYLAVIHRLDQPVKGILVFAKTSFAAKQLNKQLTDNQFGKYYKASVCGIPPATAGTLTDFLLKDSKSNCSSICSADTLNAKKATLNYSVLEYRQNNITELEVTLETGRHHQIRVQLAHLGCPIIGDTKYNPTPYPDGEKVPLALCAYKLEFKHPQTGKTLTFSI